MTTTSRVARGTAIAAGAAALMALLATPAAIAAPIAATLAAVPPTTTTVPYGSYWNLEYSSTDRLDVYDVFGIEVTGIPGVSGDFFGAGYSPNFFENYFSLYNGQTSRLIDVGSYSVGVNLNAATSTSETLLRATTVTPHTLVITPAELIASLRANPASADPQNSVISMTLGGDWITSTVCCDYRSTEGRAILNTIPAPPAGTWDLTITNTAGDVISEQQFEQVRGDAPATVYLWVGSPIGESVTVEAIFTATGDEGRNFAVTQAQPLTFTTGTASRPVIELPDVPEAPPTAVRTGVDLPFWLLVVMALVGLGAGTAGVVLGVRARQGFARVESGDASDAVDSGTNAVEVSVATGETVVGTSGSLDVDIDDGDSADTINDAFGGWSLSSSEGIDDTDSNTGTKSDD